MNDLPLQAKILIVDDVPANIHLLMDILKTDYAVMGATSGARALHMAAVEPRPELILLDVVMPELDGYEVCTMLKANPATREIPVIFISALREEADEAKGLHLGAIDYIHKPFSRAVVKARIKNHLERVRFGRQLQNQNQQLLEAAQLREDVERITRHDLKTPLTAIINMPEMLMEAENITDNQRRMLQYVTEAGYRMLGMINRSLDLYKMETGSYLFQAQAVNLLPLFNKLCEEMHAVFPDHPVHLTLAGRIPERESAFTVEGEELLCYSLFGNLLRNALEASPAGEAVTVSPHAEGARGVVSIRNAGEVPAAIRTRFFEKYMTYGKTKGTGLGTYSARLMARIQQGGIDLDCSEAGFTTIRVWLPAKAEVTVTEPALFTPDMPGGNLAEEHIHALLQHIKKGDIQALITCLSHLETNGHAPELMATLSAMADNFELKALRFRLENMLEESGVAVS